MTDACPFIETELTLDEAWSVLDPWFVAVKELFVERGFPLVAKTKLYVAPYVHDTARHFAATRDDGLVMILSPEMVELPEPTADAIIKHEFGHAVDFLYPGEFSVGKDRALVRTPRADFVRNDGERADKRWARWQRAWEARDADQVEYTADAIAELVDGRPIGYSGPCLLQCFDRGRARPQGLR